MAFKFVALFTLLAIATAQQYSPQYYQQPQYQAQPVLVKALQPTLVKAVKHVEYPDTPPAYKFSYSVHDEQSGDFHSHTEERNGDDVKGVYSLVDADGFQRVVQYTADEHNGFNAVVQREPLQGHQVVKAVAPVARVVAPVQYHQPAPVVHYQPAPVQHYQPAPVPRYQPASVLHYQPVQPGRVALPARVAVPQYPTAHGGLSSNYNL